MSHQVSTTYLLANVGVGIFEQFFHVRSQVPRQFGRSDISNGRKCQADHVLVNMMQVAAEEVPKEKVSMAHKSGKCAKRKQVLYLELFSLGRHMWGDETYFLRELVTSMSTS